MKIEEKDVAEITQRIRRRLKGLAKDDLSELVNEAISFLSERHIRRITPSVYRELRKRLTKYRTVGLLPYLPSSRRPRGRVIRVADLQSPEGVTRTDEEALNWAATGNRSRYHGVEADLVYGIQETDEERMREYQTEIEHWKGRLPAIEFEALQLLTGLDVTTHLTYGLTQRGMEIFFRRARIRMKWATPID